MAQQNVIKIFTDIISKSKYLHHKLAKMKDQFSHYKVQNIDIDISEIKPQGQGPIIQIYFSTKDLKISNDISNGFFFKVYLRGKDKQIIKKFRTKVYKNIFKQDIQETVELQYQFASTQKVFFEAYQASNPPNFIGITSTSVSKILKSASHRLLKSLLNGEKKQRGCIEIRIDKIHLKQLKTINLSISAQNLRPRSHFWCFCPQVNPFYKLERQVGQSGQFSIYQSQTANSPDPFFKECKSTFRKICKNNKEMKLKIKFFDRDLSGKSNDRSLGEASFTLAQILSKGSPVITKGIFMNDQNKNKNKQESVGLCRIEITDQRTYSSFQSFLKAGLQLNLVTCIDFTQSNLYIKDEKSLHYIPKNGKSQYELALYEVSKIVLPFDSDKLVPMYGFGAIVEMQNFDTKGRTSHCFPLNGNEANPEVSKLQGIRKAYREALPKLQFSSPTWFHELLSEAIKKIQKFENQQYMILFILTDGQIDDKQQTIDRIIQCCNLPISIIIVGVGEGDFDQMEELNDNEKKLTSSKGIRTTRDLVQFVKFNKFKNNPTLLAQNVLSQLPFQVEQYFGRRGLTPKDIKRSNRNINLNPQQNTSINIPQPNIPHGIINALYAESQYQNENMHECNNDIIDNSSDESDQNISDFDLNEDKKLKGSKPQSRDQFNN